MEQLMTLSHIQLNTPKLEEQVQFYEKYFDFKRKAHGKGWFLWNRAGFMMAVNPLSASPVLPDWFHIGFRYETKEEVTKIFETLKADGFDVGELDSFEDYMQFRFPDPTGYIVEVFWEPPPALWGR
jgi:catechol 2,3-dioxygenase-like lactoylglutathione lyase family enzyme